MDGMLQEIRYAGRRLLRSPGFTVAAVLTLALAIGANAAIFAVVERVVLKPLPYPESDRLIELDHGSIGLNMAAGFGNTPGLYFHYVDRSHTIAGAALYRTGDVTLTGDGEPERVRATRATPSLASVLRFAPALGRWFVEAEGLAGAAPVAVLSHALWSRRYRSDPHVLGRQLMLQGVQMEIVGVMPASFAFPDPRVDVWTVEPMTRAMGFGLWGNSGVARLRDGVTMADVRAEMKRLIADLPTAFPNDPFAQGNVETKLIFAGRTLKEATVGGIAGALWMLLAAVGLVLMVACANVANLFLVRSEARQRDVAVRRALGASRLGIARYFLSESLMLSAAGGAAGLALAWGAVRLLVAFGPANLPRAHEIRLDGVTATFTLVVTTCAAIAFGAVPLWHSARMPSALTGSGRGQMASRGRHVARHLLMGAQVALALVLLVASGLMIRSFQHLRAIDPGFDASSALTFSIGLPERHYPTRRAAVAAHHEIVDRLSALPGVQAVSTSTCLPLAGGCFGNTMRIEGRTYSPQSAPPIATFRAVAGGYFEAMGMRILRGRGIDRRDVERSEPIAVVSEVVASHYFANEDPLGRRIASNRAPVRPGEPPPVTWLTIVGIVVNTPARALGEATPLPQVYMPMSVAGGPEIPMTALVGPNVSVMSYIVRSATPPLELVSSIRRAIDGVDKDLALAQVRTLQDTLDRAAAQMAFTMVLLAIAAGITLMLGVVGIYGVTSYIVTLRTGEIGVRLALGADPARISGLIVRQGGAVALAGLVSGLAFAYAGSRLIASLLYGVSPHDPAVFAGTTASLLAVALVACWVPARRAARLRPLDAMRSE